MSDMCTSISLFTEFMAAEQSVASGRALAGYLGSYDSNRFPNRVRSLHGWSNSYYRTAE